MDKNFRLFGKISIIDICAVMLLICGIWFLKYTTTTASATAEGAATSRYTVKIIQKREDFLVNFKPGENVRDVLKNYEIGTLVDCYMEPHKKQSIDIESNIIRETLVDGYYDVYLVIEAPLQTSESATHIGPYEVMVSKTVYVKTKHFSAQGVVTKLERGDKNAY